MPPPEPAASQATPGASSKTESLVSATPENLAPATLLNAQGGAASAETNDGQCPKNNAASHKQETAKGETPPQLVPISVSEDGEASGKNDGVSRNTILKRMRRMFAAKASGKRDVPDELLQQWEDVDKGREQLIKIFLETGLDKDLYSCYKHALLRRKKHPQT